jgi:hypothetical protein
MALVAGDPFDTREYTVEFSTAPIVVNAGVPIKMFFTVRHPGSGAPIRNFEVVHDKRYHLFIVGRDMDVFEHIHPEQRPDGSWEIEVKLPKPGYYQILSDFIPTGGSPQFIGRTLVTTDFDGDLESQAAHLEPDTVVNKTVGSITAHLQLEPSILVAGQYGHLSFALTDAVTGQPVTDLQPYLGAFGHALILSEDMLDYVHSHSLDILAADDDDGVPQFIIPPGSDLEKLRGGPDVTFDGLMPRPGRYRAWTQFRRNDLVHTFTTTFSVVAP